MAWDLGSTIMNVCATKSILYQKEIGRRQD